MVTLKKRNPPKKFELAEDIPLFDRQPGEPDKAWQAFVFYRNLEGKRSQSAASVLYQKTYGGKGGKSLRDWYAKLSTRYQWRKRVEAWDRVLDRRVREQRIYAREEMQRRHIELAKSMQGIGALGARQLYNELKNRVAGGAMILKPSEIAALMDSGTKLERLNMGEPDTIQEKHHVFDVEKERATLQRLVENPELVDAISEALRDEGDSD